MKYATAPDGRMVVQDEYPQEMLLSSQTSAEHGGNDSSRASVEYARSCGLAIDHGSIDPFALIYHLTTSLPPAQADDYGSPDTIFKSPPAPPSMQEKLVLTKSASGLLNCICTPMGTQEAESLANPNWSRPLNKFKLELPLLPSDPEEDCRDFVRQVCALGRVNLKTALPPLIPADIEKDEGLEFPSRFISYDDDVIKSIVSEKPDVGIRRETLLYLHDAFDASWTEKDEGELWDFLHAHKGDKCRLFTPPLSPRVDPAEPVVLNAEDCPIPILSDPSSRFSDDLRTLEAQFLEEDALSPQTSDEAEYLPEIRSENPSPQDAHLSAIREAALEDGHRVLNLKAFKLEVPLLPGDSRSQAETVDPKSLITALHCPEDDITEDVLDLMEKDLVESLQALAENAARKVEQEQLLPGDTKARLPVPPMDFSIPESEWRGIQDARTMFEWMQRDCPELWHLQKWSINRAIQNDLLWSPFLVACPKPRLEEEVEPNPELLDHFLSDAIDENVPTSSDFVWKRSTLGILSNIEDEDDLEPRLSASPVREKDVAAKKRKRTMSNLFDNSIPRQINKASEAADGAERPRQRYQESGDLLVASDEHAAPAKLLSNFLSIQAPKKMRLDLVNEPGISIANEVSIGAPVDDLSRLSMPAAICPVLNLPNAPPRVIISHVLLRGVRRRLEHLIPGVELIERDYSAHNTTVWVPGSACRSERASPLADDADITISPATGLLFTTMMKVRQKPLPGSKSIALLKTRIEKASARYERLLVLVSEANIQGEVMGNMSSMDAAAFAEFQSFLASLDTDAVAFYVGGADETLAKWVAALVCQYCHEGGQVQNDLIEEETSWELFLRRAGLNAYAAQAVIKALSAPTEDVAAGWANCGLMRFVQMTREERLVAFEQVLGGRRQLDRAGCLLDAQWRQPEVLKNPTLTRDLMPKADRG